MGRVGWTIAPVCPNEGAGMGAQVPHLAVQGTMGNVLLLRGPGVVLPGAAADEAGHQHDAFAVGNVVNLLVPKVALEADGVETHIFHISHVGFVGLGIPAREHVPHVAAAAEEDVLTVDLVADERSALDRRAVIGELADAELDRFAVPCLPARCERNTQVDRVPGCQTGRATTGPG